MRHNPEGYVVHDGLCPYSDMTDWVECEDCNLIDTVRMDTLAKCLAAVEQQAEWSGVSNDDWISGHVLWTMVNNMNAALRALLPEGSKE